MKNTRTFNWVLITAALAAFVFCAFVTSHAQAQTADAPAATANAIADTATAVATPFIITFAQAHPWILTALAAIATLRLVFKPLVSAIEAYVRSSPSTDDDALLDRVEHSRTFKLFAYLLDWLGSIKVGPQFTAKPELKREG